jgi:hypothetical protein
MNKVRLISTMGALVLSATALLVAAPANAADSGTVTPQSVCSGDYYFYKANITSHEWTQASQSNSSVTGGPGVTLAISTSTTFTVSGSITITGEVSLSDTIVSVKASVGATIGKSKSGTTTNSGSWTVPASYNKGRLAIGTEKYKGTTTRYHETKSCTNVASGSPSSYNAPSQEWDFEHFKVS